MQQAARNTRAHAPAKRGGARLRVVPPVRAKSPGAPRRRGRAAARSRAIFTTGVALLVALTGLGLVRVAVLARAAEMTISADRLSQRIKEQRIESDRLEIDRSSLSTPSRIEGIATESMHMGDPASVRYISMPGDEAPDAAPSGDDATIAGALPTAEPQVVGTSPATADGRAARVFDAAVKALVDMSAGEAQSLLVGDLGLAGSR